MKTWSKTLWRHALRPLLSRIKSLASVPVRSLQRIGVHPIAWFYGGPASAIGQLHELYHLTPERVLAGYAQGIFATGERNGEVCWHCPDPRAIIHTDRVHISKRLKGYLRKDRFQVCFDQNYDDVLIKCADRETTWITPQIMDVYRELFRMRFAHSVEAYLDGQLVGGGYGVALGNVFFLESMFCCEDQASKVAFVFLAEKLCKDGFAVIDCQFMTEHWRRFGAEEVSHQEFQELVVRHLNEPAVFSGLPIPSGVTMPATAVSDVALQ